MDFPGGAPSVKRSSKGEEGEQGSHEPPSTKRV